MNFCPLIDAIIRDDLDAAKKLPCNGADKNLTDAYGFTAIELARYLGRKKLLEFFKWEENLEPIKIVLPSHSTLQKFSAEEFFFHTQVHFISFPYFESYDGLIDTAGALPRKYKKNSALYELKKEELELLQSGFFTNVTIVWINEQLGYGLLNNRDLQENEWVGFYAGAVRSFAFWRPNINAYCVHYPAKLWQHKSYVFDAQELGNYARFINHSNSPNLNCNLAVYKGLVYFILRANTYIAKGSWLSIDYGKNFWRKRHEYIAYLG